MISALLAALNAKNLKLKEELKLIQREEKKRSVMDQLCGKKRDRTLTAFI